MSALPRVPEPEATRWLFGATQSVVTSEEWAPASTWSRFPFPSRFQKRTAPSTPPETSVLRSAEKASAVTQPRCASRLAILLAFLTPGGRSSGGGVSWSAGTVIGIRIDDE